MEEITYEVQNNQGVKVVAPQVLSASEFRLERNNIIAEISRLNSEKTKMAIDEQNINDTLEILETKQEEIEEVMNTLDVPFVDPEIEVEEEMVQ